MQSEGSDGKPDRGDTGESGRKSGQSAVASGFAHRESVSGLVEVGMLAGTIGAIAADAWFILSSLVMGAPAWAPFRYISTIILGLTQSGHAVHTAAAVGVGIVFHLLAMSLLGGLYGLLADGRSGQEASAFGVCYGLAMWILLQYVAVPLVRPEVSALINPFVTAVSMLYYGLILGYAHALMTKRYAISRQHT